MDVAFDKVGKRYLYEWIFRELTLHIPLGSALAISGPNGCGKTTLLRIISGQLSPSEGKVTFSYDDKPVPKDEVYRHVSLAAPWMDLIEIFTPSELIAFHRRLRPFIPGIDADSFLEIAKLEDARHKEIRFFSSGMKQRLRLALAFCTSSSVLLLDEPTSNLDTDGIHWFHQLAERFRTGRTIVIASNVEDDFRLCSQLIHIPDFKKGKLGEKKIQA
ncbi:MAG: hypothetical protein KatS3mg029_0384 [Saprospiraceae bacterium]|nr:MAG: hypothetical protein KatS3mg029_0384 [Saprospiraceae bacterium]